MSVQIKTGVIGHPVTHSLSPYIHNYWIKQHGLSGTYEAIDILPDRLSYVVPQLVEQGYAGFNVTVPHKIAVMALCKTIDDAAQNIGAVNTVIVKDDGSLHGMNTDSFGFAENLIGSGKAFNLEKKTALVLGAGGAARGIVHALLSIGMQTIKICNRTRKKAEMIEADFPVSVIDWERRAEAVQGAALVVNTTSLGMAGQPPLDFDLQYLQKDTIVCDIVYKPLQTLLLKSAQERGNPVITGIGMLLHQARPAFKEWYGVMPDVTEALQQEIMEMTL